MLYFVYEYSHTQVVEMKVYTMFVASNSTMCIESLKIFKIIAYEFQF